MQLIHKIKDYSLKSIYKEILKKRLKKSGIITISKYVNENQTRKLHIGCGGNEFEGWLNTDIEPYTKSVAFLNAGEAFPIDSNTFDCVYSEHVFEHLTLEQQINYLHESFRILKSGGVIRIATPNFNFLMELQNAELSDLQKRYIDWNFNHFLPKASKFLSNEVVDKKVYVINNYFKDWGHQLIHNPNSIIELITLSGFKNIEQKNVGESEVKYLINIEHHANQITEEFNLLETMVFEAVK